MSALENLSASARSLSNVLAVLDPEYIQESLIVNLVIMQPVGEFPSTKYQYTAAMNALVESSLVLTDGHDQSLLDSFLRAVTCSKMTAEQTQKAFELAVGILHLAWPGDAVKLSHDTSTSAQADMVIPHVRKLWGIYMSNPQWIIPINVLGELSDLLQNSGCHVTEAGNMEAAEDMFRSALNICDAFPDLPPQHHADALFCLICHFAGANRPELLLTLAKTHFDIRMEMENQNPRLGFDAGVAHSQMALALLRNDRYEETINYAIISRHIEEKTPEYRSGEYWPFWAIMYHALALLGLDRGDDAVDMLLETLRWREAKYGPDDTESFQLGYTLQVLGSIRAKQGNYAESRDLFERALANYKATVGSKHHRTGHVLVKLAEEHARLRAEETELEASKTEAEAASGYFEQALEVFGGNRAHEREFARTLFMKAAFDKEIGGRGNETDDLLRIAWGLYAKCSGIDTNHLSRSDFDKTVAIWAR